MASRSRYMSTREFGGLLAELCLTENIFQDALLEFLERQRMVVPAARINWPTAVVIEARGGAPIPAATAVEQERCQMLDGALRAWRRHDADPELTHPFDLGDDGPGAALIVKDLAAQAFIDWEDFRTNIRGPTEEPLYVTDAVDTYYHDWQALLVADAVEMGIQLIFDTRRSDLMRLAIEHRLGELPESDSRGFVSLRAPRGLRDGMQWTGYLDAAALVETVRVRKLTALSVVHSNAPTLLDDAEQADLNATQKRAAEQALGQLGARRADVKNFLTYLIERWDEWERRGRSAVAAEYKRQIGLAARMAMHAYDIDFPALVKEIGRVTGHFADTLDVIFPDWRHDAREKAELSLKHSVMAKAPMAEPALQLDDPAVTDLLDWLERRDQWKVHLGIEAMLKHQFSGSPVDQSALAKEVESLSTTFEHLVSALLDEAGASASGTLMKKVQRFWNAVPDVHTVLETEFALVGAKAPRAAQLVSIGALPATSPNAGVAKTILAAVLYRNDGQHNGMAGWTEAELHEAARIFLTAMMFCRKNLLGHPPT